jgi:hypothetical protein
MRRDGLDEGGDAGNGRGGGERRRGHRGAGEVGSWGQEGNQHKRAGEVGASDRNRVLTEISVSAEVGSIGTG